MTSNPTPCLPTSQILAGFQSRKAACLSKRDKSSAGRIDPKAVEICAFINAREEYYTTSSCAGRCFLYRGDGIKGHHHFTSSSDKNGERENINVSSDVAKPTGFGFFQRFRVSHDVIRFPDRYFDLSTLDQNLNDYDPTGGGDPVRSIGQYDYKKNMMEDGILKDEAQNTKSRSPIWLRYEPFILHVMCRTLAAASALMAAARPSLKNVGLTAWKQGYGRYIVAIWGDEMLDMPVTTPRDMDFIFRGQETWLSELVNERHNRNWQKIERFVKAVRSMPKVVDDITYDWVQDSHGVMINEDLKNDTPSSSAIPKRYDVIGDVALIHSKPSENDTEAIGKAIMAKNKVVKIVAIRSANLSGTERSPGSNGLTIIAGPKRSPLITTVKEYGVKCVVDLNNTFFSVRMGPERLRICQQVARGENVLVLFSGVGIDAIQIAARCEATVLAVEQNPVAVECAKRGHRMLVRNKAVKCAGAAERLTFLQGEAVEVMKTLRQQSFDRILAPRPKEGDLDGDLGVGDGGATFLEHLLPLLKEQGEAHWYDFAADHELPHCERTKKNIQTVCERLGMEAEVIHVAKVGSIAMRQIRVCIDLRIIECLKVDKESST